MKKKIVIVLSIIILLAIGVTAAIFLLPDKETKPSVPKVYFTGDMSGMETKKDEKIIQVEFKSDELEFSSYANIKLQGTSSLAYDKKNYTIKLYNDEQCKEKNKVDVGWGEQNKYCLKANWIDKTHARNIVTAKIASELQKDKGILSDTPNFGVIDGFPVEIYLNGEFLGLYTWNIPKDLWMYNMDEDNENHIALVAENYTSTCFFEAKADMEDGNWENVDEPSEADFEKLNRLIDFVMNSSDEEFSDKFGEYLNFDATMNYYIMTKVALLKDNMAKNLIIITYDGNIWYPVLYDLDTSWGTMTDGLSLIDYNITETDGRLWNRFEKIFSKEIKERYNELRKTHLSEKNIMNEFKKFRKMIPEESFAKEAERWENIPGYDYSQIEDFLKTRLPLIDNYIKNL